MPEWTSVWMLPSGTGGGDGSGRLTAGRAVERAPTLRGRVPGSATIPGGVIHHEDCTGRAALRERPAARLRRHGARGVLPDRGAGAARPRGDAVRLGGF